MDTRENAGYAALGVKHDNELDLRPVEDLLAYLREYGRERPEVVALACLGIGFVLGWKLKPW